MNKDQDLALHHAGALDAATRIYEISLLASDASDLGQVLQAIANRVLTETDADYVGISLVDERRKELVHQEGAIRGDRRIPVGHRTPLGQGVVGQVAATGRLFSLPNVELFKGYVPLVPEMRCELAVPLMSGDDVLGVLNLESTQLGKFGDTERAMVLALATPIAMAVRNARLFHEERRARQQLGLVHKVVQLAATATDLDHALRRVVRAIRSQLGYNFVGIGLVTDDGEHIEVNAISSDHELALQPGHRQSLGEGVVGQVVLTGNSLLVDDVTAFEPHVPASTELRAEVCCPIRAEGRVIAVLNAENREPGSFDQADLLMLETLADHLAQVFVNRLRQEQLRQLREDLSGMLVHDLRAPVTVIQSTLQLLAMHVPAPDEEATADSTRATPRRDLRPYLQHSQRACDELTVLIDSLLGLQKLEAGELIVNARACAPCDIAASVAARLGVVAESRGIDLSYSCREELPSARLDIDLVSRVLQNLVTNALKFTPSGGEVVLATDLARPELLSKHLPHRAEGLLYEIQDNGPGIPEGERERIFEKFGVVQSRQAGHKVSTGLGLAFCREAVAAHDGAIWVENAPGGGSIFSVLLPLAPAEG